MKIDHKPRRRITHLLRIGRIGRAVRADHLFRSTVVFSGFTLLSRIFGLGRDIALAAVLGATIWADAFLIAFRLPMFFRRLFAEGAFQSVFSPLHGRMVRAGYYDTVGFAWRTFWWTALGLTGLVVVGELAMPLLIRLIAPGIAPETFDQVVLAARIMFPFIFCAGLSAWAASVLTVGKRFLAVGALPVLLNIALIGVLIWCSAFAPAEVVLWLAVGVLGAGVLQLAVFLGLAWRRLHFLRGVSLREGSALDGGESIDSPTANSVRRTEDDDGQGSHPQIAADATLQAIWRRAFPVLMSNGALQVMTILNTALATLIGGGTVTYLYLADRLVQFPMALIGTALGTTLLPLLSVMATADREDAFRRSMQGALVLAFPAAVGLGVLASPLVTLLFGHRNFGAEDIYLTQRILVLYAAGLPAFILCKVYASRFHAAGNTSTPFRIVLLGLVVNAIGAVATYTTLGAAGLALATSVGGWVQVLGFQLMGQRLGLVASFASLGRPAVVPSSSDSVAAEASPDSVAAEASPDSVAAEASPDSVAAEASSDSVAAEASSDSVAAEASPDSVAAGASATRGLGRPVRGDVFVLLVLAASVGMGVIVHLTYAYGIAHWVGRGNIVGDAFLIAGLLPAVGCGVFFALFLGTLRLCRR